MRNLPIYQVDAFTTKLFGGNPAAVVPVPDFPNDDVMQSIARENNLSETAFVVIRGPGKFDIRWFTPTREVRLCGHATLAAAHVLYRSGEEKLDKMRFKTQKAGNINVLPVDHDPDTGAQRYALTFKADSFKKSRSTRKMRGALAGIQPQAIYSGTDDIVAVLKNEKEVKKLRPNLHIVRTFNKRRGLIVTAPGKKVDFVSRCFYPAYGIDEDPVTGSAHTLLTPLWADRLGKKKLTARQISKRGGDLYCELKGKKVRLTGAAVTYLTGQLLLEG